MLSAIRIVNGRHVCTGDDAEISRPRLLELLVNLC